MTRRSIPQRRPKAPWLYDAADLRPQGEPEIQVFMGTSVLVGLHIRGVESAPLLAVRWEDGPMTLLIADGPITEAALDPNVDESRWSED